MIIVGLTGSIGMGKSTAAAMLRRMGVPVYDADAAVHRLMGRGGRATERIAAEFPGVVGDDGRVDRQKLGARVLGDERALKRLEAIVHPLVRSEETRFIDAARRRRADLVVLDIPLLLETGGEKRCDYVIVVSAPRRVQWQRVMRRQGMTAEKLSAILSRQMPDAEKRQKADYVVPTGLGRATTWRALRQVIEDIRRRGPRRTRGNTADHA